MSYNTTNITIDNVTSTNVSRHGEGLCSEDYPDLDIYLEDLLQNPVEMSFVILCLIGSVVTTGLYVTEIFSKQYKYKEAGKRLGTYLVLGIYPMTATMACISVIVPRATLLTDLLASCYLALCLYTFTRLLINYYGNTDVMLQVLQEQKVSLRSPPCCCCCCCLPAVNVSSRSVNIMKSLVFQAVCIQPIFYFLQAILWANDNTIISKQGFKSPMTYINLVIVTSILLAIYGLQFFVRASIELLAKHRIRLKFMVLQFVLLFSNLQTAIFESVLAKFGVPACKGRWGTTVRASMIHHMMLVFEMLVLGVLARLVYRKSEFRNVSQLDVTVHIRANGTETTPLDPVPESGREDVAFA